ncbi:hypothetical protein Tco_0639037, partial [Tanacetum coccineum]
MEFQDIISSSLRKDMKELQSLQEKCKKSKRNATKIFNGLSELEGFVRVMDYLELQLATEEVHEKSISRVPTRKNYVVNTQGFRDLIIRFLEGIENGIDAKESHEEVLRIKERDVNERRKKERHMIELEMLKLEKMTQKGECSNTGNAQRAKLSQKKCLIHFRLLHTLLEDFSKEDLTNACFSSGFHRAFSSLFREEVQYFAPRLFFNLDKLEKQLNAEEFNEEIAMVVFKVLKNQLQQFMTMQISMDSDDQKTNHFFTEYTLCDAQMFQNILISLMDSIEKAIAKKGLYKRVHDSRVNKRTMQTHEGMISKDASEIDNNVAGASHDKDNITEVQSSNNEMIVKILTNTKNASEMFEKTKTDHKKLTEENVLLKKEIEVYKEKAFKQDEDKYVNNIIQLEAKNKDLENIVCKMGKLIQTLCMLTNEQRLYQENKPKNGLGYTDPCPLGQAIACHPKLYDAEVLGLHYVKPDVHDTVEILNDAEESQVKMKEKQFQFNYENINSLYDTFVPQMELSLEQEYFSDPSTSNVSSELSLDEPDVPPKEMPNEGKFLKLFVNLDSEIKKLVTFNIDFHMDKHRNVDRQGIQQLFSHEVVLISHSLNECLTIIQQEIKEEVKEMLDIFESMERNVARTSKKNEILQNKIDQLLKANIANDVKNLVMQSYVEIKNKEEIERFSKKSKDSEKFCNDVVEVKEKFSELETESGEKKNLFESETCDSQIKIVELEKTLAKQTKENYDLLMKIDNLENAFADEVKGVTTGKLNVFDKENCDFGSKVTHLEKIIAQKTKDFDDVELELSNKTAKFEAYFEKLKNTKVVLERQLARKVDDSKA